MTPNFDEELTLWKQGFDYIIGIDEVGRGAFAGPVVVGAVIFDRSCIEIFNTVTHQFHDVFHTINDSKQVKPMLRKRLAKEITLCSLDRSISTIPVTTINKIGIGKATSMAMRKAIGTLFNKYKEKNCFVLVDGFHIKYLHGLSKWQKAIVKGDQKSISIAAASIIAKVYRDGLMKELDKIYPQYLFGKHKGYGTAFHQKAIKKYGLSPIHRTSFSLEKFLI